MLLGTAHAEREIQVHRQHFREIQHPVDITVTPSEITATQMGNKLRTHHFWIDSSAMGDVLWGGVGMFSMRETSTYVIGDPSDSAMGRALEARYDQMGRPSETDPPGRRLKYCLPYSVGIAQAILARGKSRESRSPSRNCQLAAQRLNDIWQRELQLPMFAETQTCPSLPDRIVIFGGAKAMWEVSRDGQRDRRRFSLASNP